MSPKYEYEKLHLSLFFVLHTAQLKDAMMNSEASQRCTCNSLRWNSLGKNLQMGRDLPSL